MKALILGNMTDEDIRMSQTNARDCADCSLDNCNNCPMRTCMESEEEFSRYYEENFYLGNEQE